MKIDLEKLKINDFENEEIFQAKAIMLISQEFPKLRGKFFHVQNEQHIPRKEKESDKAYKERCLHIGNINKAKGKLAGVMDILIVFNGILYKIELKQPSGKLGEKQHIVIDAWFVDCPNLKTQIAYTLYHVYMYCKWIVSNDLKILFPPEFKIFEL